jgi:metal-responsive CopG/Arc/MetJ family transcriptional regulator
MGKAKIKIDKDLFEKVKKFAAISGYTSPEEFITHLLEKEIATIEEADTEEEIKKKLKGLGYIS